MQFIPCSDIIVQVKCLAPCPGITLSQNQVKRATELAEARGINNASFSVMDALNMSHEDGKYDLVWACESGEHMPNKEKYVQEMTRVLKPGESPHTCLQYGHQAPSMHCRPSCPSLDKHNKICMQKEFISVSIIHREENQVAGGKALTTRCLTNDLEYSSPQNIPMALNKKRV